MRDGLAVLRPRLTVNQTTVDMTLAQRRLEDARRQGVHATPTHLLVHAAARALAANPDLHQVVAGNRRHRPDRVDIGLSVANEIFVAPVLIIEGADRKTLEEIAAEITRRAPEVRAADQRMLQALRTWGWVVPFGFLRRALLRLCFTSPAFRRKGAGTFQVSTTPTEWAMTSIFSAAAVLVGGRISPRVVAIDGQPAVRPMMTLTLSFDHGVWDGRAAGRYLEAVKAELDQVEPGRS